MRAVIIREFGPVESHQIEEVPTPTPGPGEVLIDVHAIGVNFPDSLMVQGLYQTKPERPFTPGRDAAGVGAVPRGAGGRGRRRAARPPPPPHHAPPHTRHSRRCPPAPAPPPPFPPAHPAPPAHPVAPISTRISDPFAVRPQRALEDVRRPPAGLLAAGLLTPSGDAAWWRAPSGERVLLYHLPPSGYELGANLPTEADAAAARWEADRRNRAAQ